jgi:hypothetical protein
MNRTLTEFGCRGTEEANIVIMETDTSKGCVLEEFLTNWLWHYWDEDRREERTKDLGKAIIDIKIQIIWNVSERVLRPKSLENLGKIIDLL